MNAMNNRDQAVTDPTSNLLPCPFCGHKISDQDPMDTIYPVGRLNNYFQVVCQEYATGCGAVAHGDSPEDAAKNWNRRVGHAVENAARGQLIADVKSLRNEGEEQGRSHAVELLDRVIPALSQSAGRPGTNAKHELGHARYEYLRRLNPRQFAELYERNIRGEGRFDDLVDEARKQEKVTA